MPPTTKVRREMSLPTISEAAMVIQTDYPDPHAPTWSVTFDERSNKSVSHSDMQGSNVGLLVAWCALPSSGAKPRELESPVVAGGQGH
jgi:hypothetical protein